MATLKSRLDVLGQADTKPDQGSYLEMLPVMAYDEWCEAAAKQQAELCAEVSNGNP